EASKRFSSGTRRPGVVASIAPPCRCQAMPAGRGLPTPAWWLTTYSDDRIDCSPPVSSNVYASVHGRDYRATMACRRLSASAASRAEGSGAGPAWSEVDVVRPEALALPHGDIERSIGIGPGGPCRRRDQDLVEGELGQMVEFSLIQREYHVVVLDAIDEVERNEHITAQQAAFEHNDA